MDWSNIINQITQAFSGFITDNGTPGGQINIPFGPSSEPKFDGTDLKLVRDIYTEFSTQGNLFINNVGECYTIECPKESYEGSHVCIPCGTYVVELVDSPKHGPNTPQLKDVPGRTYIQMHSSNWAINPETKQVFLLGCIAPGTTKDPNVVYNSKIAMAALMAKIDWTKKVRITITEQ
jgi:hypothetical protein